MAYKIVIKQPFNDDLRKVLEFLQAEWGNKVAENFMTKIDSSLLSLEHHPFIGAPSNKMKNARCLFITRHNRLFYKVVRDKVIIARLYDTRQKNYQ